jgi:hypothetical protein
MKGFVSFVGMGLYLAGGGRDVGKKIMTEEIVHCHQLLARGFAQIVIPDLDWDQAMPSDYELHGERME